MPSVTPDPAAYAQSSSGDTELFSEVLRAAAKSFYIDLKENARGRYIKVAEKGRYRPKSSIVMPVSGLPHVMALLKYYLAEFAKGRAGQPKDIIIESKVFSFSAGSNERGQYLRVSESGGGLPSGGSSLMIPAGWSNTYLRLFYESLEKISRQLGQEDGVNGLAAEDVAGNGTSSPTIDSRSPDAVVLDTNGAGPVLSVGTKHFFFEMRANDRGQYLKVKEVCGNIKQQIVVPWDAIQKFQEAMSLAAQHTGQ